MGFFEQWYRNSNAKQFGMSVDQACKIYFIFCYEQLPEYLQESWREYVKDYIISTPLDIFGPEEHLTLFIQWCHERDILV
jgi:hypothetical protein